MASAGELFYTRHSKICSVKPYQQCSVDPYESNKSKHDQNFWILVIASQIVGVTCVALVTYWGHQNGGYTWDSDVHRQVWYHPLLMVLGLVFFYGEAILVYRVLYFLPKILLKLIHAALHVVAIVSSSVGLVAIFENHRKTDKADFYSLHSWVGIAAFGFLCLQYVGSFIVFLYPGLLPTKRAKVMPFHRFFGVGVFILSVSAAHTGITERLLWTDGYTEGLCPMKGIVGNLLGILLIVFGFLVVHLATHGRYKRQPLPSES